MLWSNENREAVKKEHNVTSFGDVGKVLGEKWKTVGAEEKNRYESKAAELKVQWQKEMAAWNAVHGDDESGTKTYFFDKFDRVYSFFKKKKNPNKKTPFILDGDKKKGKGTKGKRAKKDPNAPKGATNAYMMFSKEQREKLKNEGKKVSFGEAGKIIAEKWKSLAEDEKKPYQDAADKDKKRYEKEMDDWKKKGGKVEKPAAAKKSKKEESSSSSSSSSEDEKSTSSSEAEESDSE